MKKSVILCVCCASMLCASCKDDPVNDNATTTTTASATTSVASTTTSLPAPDRSDIPRSWQYKEELAVASDKGFSVVAPDIVQLDDGSYRMYYGVSEEGIGSAKSTDGKSWTIEDGMRLESKHVEGEEDCRVSHPWVIKTKENKWRMYYQSILSEADKDYRGEFLVNSAISEDGLTFTREGGNRIGVYDSMGLAIAGHGRVLLNDNGTYVMLFSGNTEEDTGASDIMLATSEDGLDFTLVNDSLFADYHDPALIQTTAGGWAVSMRYMNMDSYLSFTRDGLQWEEPRPMTVYDSSGSLLADTDAGLGDPCMLRMPDDTIGIYANAPYSLFGDQRGIIGLVPYEE